MSDALTPPSSPPPTETDALGRLFLACESGRSADVKALAEDPELLPPTGGPEWYRERYYDGWPRAYEITPMYAACEYGHVEVVKYLAEQLRASVEACSSGGGTPFFAACCKGHLKVAQYLVQAHRVDVNQATLDGATPFLGACERGQLHVCKWLVESAQAEPARCDTFGTSPLFAACWGGHLSTVQWLLGSPVRAATECSNKFGWTPLYVSSRQGNLEIIKHLIEAGADVNVIDANGRSADDAARRMGRREVSQLLNSIHSKAVVVAAEQRLAFASLLCARLGGASPARGLPRRDNAGGGDLHDLIAAQVPAACSAKTVFRSMRATTSGGIEQLL
eukprot:SAG22_NODE_19_length_32182_cov_39.206963_13_plen_335_part_00